MAEPPTAATQRYMLLTGVELPERARSERWPLRFDHCFRRIVLDNVFEGTWYDHLDRRKPAWKQLTGVQVERAVELAQRMLDEGWPAVEELDARSLSWRGKKPKKAWHP